MKNKNTFLVVVNTFSLAIMLLTNFFASTGKYVNSTVAEVSYRYDTLFAPAGYAFAIWGIIFLLAIGFVVFQWVMLANKQTDTIAATGSWFLISNVANIAWIYCWTNEWIGLSVIMIFILLFSLVVLTARLRLELDDEPVRNIFWVWWPIAIYLGWVMVATIACVSAWLVYSNWHKGITMAPLLTIIMLVVATIIYLYLLKTRNLREASSVGIWAFVAIAVRQWTPYQNIAMAAIICSVILFVAITVHAYKNRFYNIGAKLQRKEWK